MKIHVQSAPLSPDMVSSQWKADITARHPDIRLRQVIVLGMQDMSFLIIVSEVLGGPLRLRRRW